MGRKNAFASVPILLNKTLSADFNSPVTVVAYLDNISYQINVLTTNSTGTFTVQGSSDYIVDAPTGSVINAGNWITLILNGSTANPVVAAANTNILINLNQVPFTAIRLQYTHGTAGTGTCSIYMTSKQIGG